MAGPMFIADENVKRDRRRGAAAPSTPYRKTGTVGTANGVADYWNPYLGAGDSIAATPQGQMLGASSDPNALSLGVMSALSPATQSVTAQASSPQARATASPQASPDSGMTFDDENIYVPEGSWDDVGADSPVDSWGSPSATPTYQQPAHVSAPVRRTESLYGLGETVRPDTIGTMDLYPEGHVAGTPLGEGQQTERSYQTLGENFDTRETAQKYLNEFGDDWIKQETDSRQRDRMARMSPDDRANLSAAYLGADEIAQKREEAGLKASADAAAASEKASSERQRTEQKYDETKVRGLTTFIENSSKMYQNLLDGGADESELAGLRSDIDAANSELFGSLGVSRQERQEPSPEPVAEDGGFSLGDVLPWMSKARDAGKSAVSSGMDAMTGQPSMETNRDWIATLPPDQQRAYVQLAKELGRQPSPSEFSGAWAKMQTAKNPSRDPYASTRNMFGMQ